jgi:uncharacterized protein
MAGKISSLRGKVMEIVIFTLGTFLGVFLVMSVGVIFKRKPLQGSCGGIASLMGNCDVCEMKSECVDKKKHEECHEDQADCKTTA